MSLDTKWDNSRPYHGGLGCPMLSWETLYRLKDFPGNPGPHCRQPGEFFQRSTTDMPPNPTTLVGRLKDKMHDIRATPVHLQPQRNVHVSKDLSSCTHIFIRHDAVRKPLHMMGPTESWPELTSTSRSTSMAGRIQCPLTV